MKTLDEYIKEYLAKGKVITKCPTKLYTTELEFRAKQHELFLFSMRNSKANAKISKCA